MELDAATEDLVLLTRLREGEDAAFGELYSRHADAVRRLAFGLMSDRAEAEDLTAEAFFRVLQAIRRGAGPVDNMRGYLLIVTRRVAWEWSLRRRDVPVSDEELTTRVGCGPDTSGQSTERNLIARAFTSLPERWRSVLWKVEVEGERPAVVATNFGLSPNATAALARRARQGLRAAYLQAHLTVDRGSTGCRSVLEKLGAYTAGSIKGTERRRVHAHLSTCASCTSMYTELQDVCSGLRAHAAHLGVPAVGALALHQAAGGFGATVKALLASAKIQVCLAATSAAAVGLFGLTVGPWGQSGRPTALPDDFDGKRGRELVITGDQPTDPSSLSASVPNGAMTARISADRKRPGGAQARPVPQAGLGEAAGTVAVTVTPDAVPAFDPNSPVTMSQVSVERYQTIYGDRTVVSETTVVTEVNAAHQTRVSTKTTEYTNPAGQQPRMLASGVPADGSTSGSVTPTDQPGPSASQSASNQVKTTEDVKPSGSSSAPLKQTTPPQSQRQPHNR